MSLEWWMMVTKRNPKWPVAVAVAVSQGIDKWFLCKLHGLHMIKKHHEAQRYPSGGVEIWGWWFWGPAFGSIAWGNLI